MPKHLVFLGCPAPNSYDFKLSCFELCSGVWSCNTHVCELPGWSFEADVCDEECPVKQIKFSWYHGFCLLGREEGTGFGGKHVDSLMLVTELVL